MADFMYACWPAARSGSPTAASASRTATTRGGGSAGRTTARVPEPARPTSGEPELGRLLPELVPDLRVRGVADDVSALGLLVVSPQLRHPVFGDDGALLETRHRLVEQGHDGGHVGLGVPRAQGDERLAAGGVQRSDDEVGLAPEPGVD